MGLLIGGIIFWLTVLHVIFPFALLTVFPLYLLFVFMTIAGIILFPKMSLLDL